MQVRKLHYKIDSLQGVYGDRNLKSIYGAGCIYKPDLMMIFMNPTGKNISAKKEWEGIRAPWLGTKNIWKLLYNTGLVSKNNFEKTQKIKSDKWNCEFAAQIYRDIESKECYITNLAKCTQTDARPLKDDIFRKYLNILKQEILFIKPKKIITLGNQVSSIILNKPISVKNYKKNQAEKLVIENQNFSVYPVYYPVGQGMRNMPLAVKKIKNYIKQK